MANGHNINDQQIDLLFNCKENPTSLTIINIWTKPKEVALFLKLDEEDETRQPSDGDQGANKQTNLSTKIVTVPHRK